MNSFNFYPHSYKQGWLRVLYSENSGVGKGGKFLSKVEVPSKKKLHTKPTNIKLGTKMKVI